MKCEFGFCTVCEKEIAKPCPTCGTRKPGGDYSEVQVEWSHGPRMNIAVCLDCATTHRWKTPDAKAGIAKMHHDYHESKGATVDRSLSIV